MFNVQVTSKAERSLRKISQGKKILRDFLFFLEEHPESWKQSSKIRKIQGKSDLWRYRSGNYRIIFSQSGVIYVIFDVLRRNEKTYKHLSF